MFNFQLILKTGEIKVNNKEALFIALAAFGIAIYSSMFLDWVIAFIFWLLGVLVLAVNLFKDD